MNDKPHVLTDAGQAYYDQFDADVTAGRVPAIGRGTRRDGSRIADSELDEILRGRPALGQDHATGRGRSPRRQVRLPEHTNAALDAYVKKHGTTASAVIRDALESYLANAG
ncbi:ribbon-helix-helix domain-containing protein [Actinomyces sp. MRS3W]|uniref:ribbon-helix-helix domain-containing protein n=1 Tax=Actinomyces sp. MRS3W TaxID=2800796 RepID=UPI0028FD9182|nr:ribbon-helix-helix domain-containing protein [Actinomyces sp. MRS3W]MDU0348338.1 ribbon-helix-helix domain-containing protein [Actinomyces sp. MRS3W]